LQDPPFAVFVDQGCACPSSARRDARPVAVSVTRDDVTLWNTEDLAPF
jgi:hypothetical protein